MTQVSWNAVFSSPVTVSNGVKQGGILSPILFFCIYIDSLLYSLAKSGIGCFIGRLFVGSLVYADDIVLLSPTASGMRTLLHLCDMFANDFSVVFNAGRTTGKWLSFKARQNSASYYKNPPRFLIGGNATEFVSGWPHLGHILTTDINNKTDTEHRKHSVCGQMNDVLHYFGKRQSIVKLQLMKIYCSSFYGSVLWDLDHPAIGAFCAAWRKGLRRVYCHLGSKPDLSR